MLNRGMIKRGHKTTIWTPQPKASNLPVPHSLKKWMGYIDQYLIFPLVVKKKLKTIDKDTLFVFTDNALGPWVPLVKNKKHVIHCHDFLAQRSAFEGIDENSTGFTGKLYQKMIRNGYTKGKNFISVSKKTQTDLHRFLNFKPKISEVVYNAMNRSFSPQDITKTRTKLSKQTKLELLDGYILHVGGNQWYKNRTGIIEIYTELRKNYDIKTPLVLVGTEPNELLKELIEASSYKIDIHYLSNCSDETVKDAYAGASLLLYPSLDEGFGWPIAEAMASGIPVVTTNEPPMTEVGGSAGFYISKRPSNSNTINWAKEAAITVSEVLSLNSTEREESITAGINNVKRFEQEKMLDRLGALYSKILSED
ncbi:glycosyltransferase family 4 protein [Maribacter sp. Asnod1-A12]|uniref:glycosyltransferase family 4 protein n=1 Tax=Maribacter sp. Asnod1-A12 TaxID=3160576 RepID=UPI003867ABD3